MSDELETRSDAGQMSETTLAAIEEHYAAMRDYATSLPSYLPTAKHLMHFYAVHIDETGQMEPDQDKVNTQYLASITALELRIARLEAALEAAGIAVPDLPLYGS